MCKGSRVNVSFCQEDYNIIKYLADNRGLSMSSFVRMLALDCMYHSRKQSYVDEHRDVLEVRHEQLMGGLSESDVRQIEDRADAYYRSLEP